MCVKFPAIYVAEKLAAIGASRFWPEANNGKGTDSKLFNCSFQRGKNLYPVVNRATGFVAACFGNGCAAISLCEFGAMDSRSISGR
jgi:hypothetical protein